MKKLFALLMAGIFVVPLTLATLTMAQDAAAPKTDKKAAKAEKKEKKAAKKGAKKDKKKADAKTAS